MNLGKPGKIEAAPTNNNVKLKKVFEFRERIDADGARRVISLGNERNGGCPYSCAGCGVRARARPASKDSNERSIRRAVAVLSEEIKQKRKVFSSEDYHVCVYNEGNVTNQEELCRENLSLLLRLLSSLKPHPKFVSLNSRGAFIDKELLDTIHKINLPFAIHFILGIESLTVRGSEIYGKNKIAQELQALFAILQSKNQQSEQKHKFGLDAGFVYLPEFYLGQGEDRVSVAKIKKGFVNDIGGFINQYAGRGVAIRLNLHPFYRMPGLPYDNSCDVFNVFVGATVELIDKIRRVNAKAKTESDKTALFIGMEGEGYEGGEWAVVREVWSEKIARVNALKDYDNAECEKVLKEVSLVLDDVKLYKDRG